MNRYTFFLLLLHFTSLAQSQNLSNETKLTYTTTKIDYLFRSPTTGDTIQGYASAFFFNFDIRGRIFPAIVTNKHVVNDAFLGQMYFTKSSPDGRPLHGQKHLVAFKDFKRLWIQHPSDSVDLCIAPLGHIINRALADSVELFYIAFSEDDILTNDDYDLIGLLRVN